jgi:hypothetical protein
MSDLKRCTKCILPSNFPHISFSAEGVCNYCEAYRPIQYRGQSALKDLLETYRGKGSSYDCVVPISGGKDSSFVLYQAAREYNMRVLAVNYASGFASDQAKRNVKNAIRVLGVDCVQIRSKADAQEASLKDSIEAWVLNSSSRWNEDLPALCTGCREGWLRGSYKIAARLGVPLLLLGDSEMEDTLLTGPRRFHRSYPINLFLRLMRNPFYLYPRRAYHYLLIHAEFSLPAAIYQYVTRAGPRIVHWYEYVRYDHAQILSTVTEKMGWLGPPDSPSTWRFDCQVHTIIEHMFRETLGYTDRDELYSRMIREGSLSRTEALKRVELENRNAEVNLRLANELLDKLGLSGIKGHLLCDAKKLPQREGSRGIL